MKIKDLQTFLVSIPYSHAEVSSRVNRGGVTAVVVRLETDQGLVGWGESCVGADALSVDAAVRSAIPFVVGQDPWQRTAIARSFFQTGLWDHRAMTGNFAFAGIDMALWDLCGKESNLPIYRLLGGKLRDEVDYFCYLSQGTAEDLHIQCQTGLRRGHHVFYLKVGIDAHAEEKMLEAIRATIGPSGKIRIDANQAWNVPEATHWLNRWHRAFEIDFAEAPVPIDPVECMLDLKRSTCVALCANEGLWRAADVHRIIKSRAADVLCFSSFWVGTLGIFHSQSWHAHGEGIRVCKHTHGELGLAAAAGQHVLLTIPNAVAGHQQTAAMTADDILADPIPIATTARWGAIEQPGLGVHVDQEKLRQYAEHFQSIGQYLPYKECEE